MGYQIKLNKNLIYYNWIFKFFFLIIKKNLLSFIWTFILPLIFLNYFSWFKKKQLILIKLKNVKYLFSYKSIIIELKKIVKYIFLNQKRESISLEERETFFQYFNKAWSIGSPLE